MKKLTTYLFAIILISSVSSTLFAQPAGIKGTHGTAVVQSVRTFKFSDLPRISAPYTGPITDREEEKEGEPPYAPVEPPVPIEKLKNVTLFQTPKAGSPVPFSATIGNSFEGITQGPYVPSEPTSAAGPLNVFSAGNVNVTVTNKDGSNRVETDGQTFFGANDAISDAVSMYVPQYGKFVSLCFTTAAHTYTPCHYYLAVSNSNDARGTWTVYDMLWSATDNQGNGYWGDYEEFGISGDKFVISSQQFNKSSYVYQRLRVWDVRDIFVNGSVTNFVDFNNYTGQVFVTKCGRNLDSDSTIYLLATRYAGGSDLVYGTITGSPSNPTLSFGTSVPIQTYGNVTDAHGGSTTASVNTGDCRTMNFCVRNKKLYEVLQFGTTISGTAVDAVRLVVLNVTNASSPAVLTDETFAAANFWYYYPAVTVDSVGTIFIGMDGSSNSVFPSSYVTIKRRSDSNIEPVTLSKSGTAVTSQTRWGDYTGIDMDATASGPGATYAWYAGQWTKTSNSFGTWIQQFSATYGQVAGQVLLDADGSTGTSGDRTALAGWTLTLKQGATTLATLTSDANGNYNFGYLESGTYTVVLTQQGTSASLDALPGTGGTAQSKVDNLTLSVQVTNSQTSTTNTFLQRPLKVSIAGTVFNDANNNGAPDPGEVGLTGWTVNLTGAASGSTTTNGSGNYSFTNLDPGTYTVSEVVQSGFNRTLPGGAGTYTVTGAAGDNFSGKDFGNYNTNSATFTGGGGNSDWNNSGNWSGGTVPTSSTDVTISTSSSVNINTAASCNSMTVANAGASVTLLSGNSLTVSGNFVVSSGTFNTEGSFPTVSGTVNLTGGTIGYTASSGSQTVSNRTYTNLVISGGGTKTLNTGTTTVNGSLTLSGTSTLNLNAQTLTPGGSSTLTMGSGTTLQTGGSSISGFTTTSLNAASSVQFNGSGAENIPGYSYGNLSISNIGKSLAGNATVNGTLTLGALNITTNSNTLTIGSGGSLSRTTGYVVGNLAKVTSSSGTQTFEIGSSSSYLPLTMSVSAISGSGPITASLTNSNPATAFGKGDATKCIAHYYTITIDPAISSITSNPKLTYTLAEYNSLNSPAGQAANFLARWNGTSWTSMRTTSTVPTQASAGVNGEVTLTGGVGTFSPWAIFNGTSDAALSSMSVKTWVGVGNGGAGTDFNTATNWNPSGTPTSSDSCVMICASAGTITVSADITIGALTVQETGGSSVLRLDATNKNVTVLGKTIVDAPSGNTNTQAQLSVGNASAAPVRSAMTGASSTWSTCECDTSTAVSRSTPMDPSAPAIRSGSGRTRPSRRSSDGRLKYPSTSNASEPSLTSRFATPPKTVRTLMPERPIASVQCDSRLTVEPDPPTRKSRSAP